MSLPKPLKLVILFIAHIVTGLLLAAIVAGAACLVTYAGKFLGNDGLSYYVVTGLNALGLLLFAADFICVVLFLGVQTVLFGKDLLKYAKKAWKEE